MASNNKIDALTKKLRGDSLKVELEDNVLTLTLNRPAKANALSAELVENLIDAFKFAAEHQGNVKTVVMRGAPRPKDNESHTGRIRKERDGKPENFCSGMDMSEMRAALESDHREEIKAFNRRYIDLFDAMVQCHAPILSVVEGNAIGAGCTLLMLSDRVVADSHVQIGYPEKKMRLKPWISGLYAMRRMGAQKALEYFRSGEATNGIGPLQGRIIDAMCSTKQVLDANVDFQIQILRNSGRNGKLPPFPIAHMPPSSEAGPDEYDVMAQELIEKYNSGDRDAFKDFACEQLTDEMIANKDALLARGKKPATTEPPANEPPEITVVRRIREPQPPREGQGRS